MSVHDADLNDIYVDANGKLWRCVALCKEPTVHFEEVEPREVAGLASPQSAHRTTLPKARMSGGVSGLMWAGFALIYRAAPAGDR